MTGSTDDFTKAQLATQDTQGHFGSRYDSYSLTMATSQELRSLPDDKKPSVGIALTTSDDDTPDQQLTSETSSELKSIPWTYKWIALACVIAFPIGSNWTNASLGPLKNTLRQELGVTNAQFGVISSADSFVNSIFPIIGGMTLDWWGPNRITVCCTFIIFVGATVAAIAVHVETWRMLAAGHVLMGFGVAILDQAQQKVWHYQSFNFFFFLPIHTADICFNP